MFPFAGIVNRNDVPFSPELGEWKLCHVVTVFLKDIHLTQDCLVIKQLFNNEKVDPLHDDYIHLLCWQNKLYLLNGHHRAAKAALRGELIIEARVASL